MGGVAIYIALRFRFPRKNHADLCLPVRRLRPQLESGTHGPQPPNLPVKTPFALIAWIAVSASLIWIATRTGWAAAWITFALASLMPALMLMVIAHTVEPPAARLMHDRESNRPIGE